MHWNISIETIPFDIQNEQCACMRKEQVIFFFFYIIFSDISSLSGDTAKPRSKKT